MIGKKHFLEQIKKLETVFDCELSIEKINIYYDALSPDFTDDQFDAALNLALKNSFRFPPIAAFYKKDINAPEVNDGEKQLQYLKSLGYTE